MRDIPGVYVSDGGNIQDITIRGMDDAYPLYLVDGRPISAGRNVATGNDRASAGDPWVNVLFVWL